MSARYSFGPQALPAIDAAKIASEQKVGIAYSGGGERVVIELGIALAFIELGITPDYIAGVSAGAYAGAFHALDPRDPRYLQLAVKSAQKGVPFLHPSVAQTIFRLLPAAIAYLFGGIGAVHLQSLVGSTRLRRLLEKSIPVKTFGELRVPLSVSATDVNTGREVWFEDPAAPIVPAVLASSAIPAIFPPVQIGSQFYIDGSVADNLPLFHLAQKGCSVIYACNVGYAGEANKPPQNLFDTISLAENIGQYSAELMQVSLLTMMYPQVKIIPVRPQVALTALPSEFNARDIPRYVAEAAAETKRILQSVGASA